MLTNMIYEIKMYWKDGVRIDELRHDTGVEYYIIMHVQTPQGNIEQRPLVPATSIEEAFEKAPEVIEATLAIVKEQLKPKIEIPNGQRLR